MKRNESTNDKIVRLFNEGWEAERIADDVKIPVGSVNSILERRVEGYADLLAKKSLEANKARTAAKEEALRREREKEEALEAKQAKYSSANKKPTLVNPDDFFNSDLDGMLVGNYKQKITEPEKETVNILTADENRNLLTGGFEETKEEVVEEAPVVEAAPVVEEAPAPAPVVETVAPAPAPAPAPAVAPAIEVDANPMATASQKMALFAQAQIAENETKIEGINALIADVMAKISASEQQNEAVKGQIADIDGQIKALYDEIAALSAQIKAFEDRKSELENSGAADTSELDAQVAAYNEQITALKAENEQYRAFIK